MAPSKTTEPEVVLTMRDCINAGSDGASKNAATPRDPCCGDEPDKKETREDTVAPPAWWRTAIAVLMTSFSDEARISYHVSNLATERQAEREEMLVLESHPPIAQHIAIFTAPLLPTLSLLFCRRFGEQILQKDYNRPTRDSEGEEEGTCGRRNCNAFKKIRQSRGVCDQEGVKRNVSRPRCCPRLLNIYLCLLTF